jgi:hypothetical protein
MSLSRCSVALLAPSGPVGSLIAWIPPLAPVAMQGDAECFLYALVQLFVNRNSLQLPWEDGSRCAVRHLLHAPNL